VLIVVVVVVVVDIGRVNPYTDGYNGNKDTTNKSAVIIISIGNGRIDALTLLLDDE
jgi:hypothetical protein